MKLSKTQQEVLDILKDPGNYLHFMEYMGSFTPNAYYFCHNNIGKRIRFDTVQVLLKKGLVVRKELDRYGGHTIWFKRLSE